jgi:DNA-binding NarL/FixJ family response regulator
MNATGRRGDTLRSVSSRGEREPTVRVLLVDDHDRFRDGLRVLLEQDGLDVADAASGEAALRRLRSWPADVVVMDLNMPGMSGIEATRRVLEQSPQTAVLVLTAAADEEAVLGAVRAGAHGYLLKDAGLAVIVAGIRAAASGESAVSPQIASGLLAHLRQTGTRPSPQPVTIPELSARERAILTLLARGCDNAQIGERLFISSSTVKSQVSTLLRKLGVDNRVQAAVYAIRHRLVELEDESPSG